MSGLQGVIDVDSLLATETIFDAGQLCTDSEHPEHVRCGAPAVYLVSWADALHGELFHRPMCSAHVTRYFRAAIVSYWCPCAHKHRECPTVGARIDRLR